MPVSWSYLFINPGFVKRSSLELTKSRTLKVSRDCETFFKSLTRLTRLSRLLKHENSNVNIVKNDPPDIFIAILCDNFLENFCKKIIVTSLGVKIGMKSAQTIFIAFLCDNFLQNLVFPNHFPCQNIPKNKIIFYKTFSKSLTRLSRLF